MLAALLIFATASMTFSVTNAVTTCTTCELDDTYTGARGYHCFQINNSTVACTCSDETYKLNHRCRICDRPNICGDNVNNRCSEISPSFGGEGDNAKYFACLCADGSDTTGKPCPPTPTITTAKPTN